MHVALRLTNALLRILPEAVRALRGGSFDAKVRSLAIISRS